MDKGKVKSAEEVAEDVFGSWIQDLEDKDQPEACSIDDEDCEACGSYIEIGGLFVPFTSYVPFVFERFTFLLVD